MADRYHIRVWRDARVPYSAHTQMSLDEIKENTSRHGFAGTIEDQWEKEDPDIFDEVEVVQVIDPTNNVTVAQMENGKWLPPEEIN